ncbi:MAG: ABC transporter substrate-binding protein [Acidimicrobiales bacterium]
MGTKELREGRHSALRFSAAAVATAVVVLGLAACSSSSTSSTGASSSKIPSGPIKLGAIYTLSGPAAAFGQFNVKSEQALIKRLNSQGGIDGHQVQFVYKNTQGTPSLAVTQASQLVADGVTGIVYDGTSGTAKQATAVFQKAKIPVVDFGVTDTWASGSQWPYAFTDYNILKPQGVTIDKYAKHLGAPKIGILTDSTPIGESLAADVKAAASSTGVTIVGTQSYSTTATNMTTQLQALKADGATSLALPGETGLGNVYTDLIGIGWSPYIFTEFAGYFVGYTSLGSLASKTFSTCQTYIPKGSAIPAPLQQLASYVTANAGVKQVGMVSGLLNENDSLLIFKDAITKANSLNGTAIRNAIETINGVGFTVPTWKYTFTASDHAGWPNSRAYMCLMAPLGPYQTPYTAPGFSGTS